jgi:hypothetical protein
VLQAGDARGQVFETLEGQFANGRRLEGPCAATVRAVLNGVQAKHLARQVEPDDLLVTVIGLGESLHRTGLDHVQVAEGLAGAEQVVAALQGSIALYDGVEAVHVFGTQPHREAEFGEAAVVTCNLDLVE